MNISLLGEVEGRAKKLDLARTAFEEAVALFEAADDRNSAAITYHQWAKTFFLNGLMEEAGEYFIHSAGIFSELSDQKTLGTVTHNFHFYLQQLPASTASYMALKWFAAKLPPVPEVLSYVANGLRLDPPEPKLEKTDHADASPRPN